MKRFRQKRKSGRRKFTKTAMRTNRRNISRVKPMRGGYRL